MSHKEVRINVRTSETTVEDLKITAKLRGLTVSALVNLLVVKAIREEKMIAPEAFEKPHRPTWDVERTDRRSQTSQGRENWRESLEKARGIWKDRDDLPDFDELRREWSRDVWKERK